VGSCWLGIHPPCSGRTSPARGVPDRRRKGARSARPNAGPSRRRTAMRLPPVEFFPSPLCSLCLCSIQARRLIAGDRDRRDNQQAGRRGQGRGCLKRGQIAMERKVLGGFGPAAFVSQLERGTSRSIALSMAWNADLHPNPTPIDSEGMGHGRPSAGHYAPSRDTLALMAAALNA